MTSHFFINEIDKPENFEYPQTFIDYVSDDVGDLEPWKLLSSSEITSILRGLKQRYLNRVVVPFARRLDNDDRACFDASESSIEHKIIIIHDFAAPGWEERAKLASFKDWLELVEEDIKEWNED